MKLSDYWLFLTMFSFVIGGILGLPFLMLLSMITLVLFVIYAVKEIKIKTDDKM